MYLAPHDIAGLQRLAEYILRCPFSLVRVVQPIEGGSMIFIESLFFRHPDFDTPAVASKHGELETKPSQCCVNLRRQFAASGPQRRPHACPIRIARLVR